MVWTFTEIRKSGEGWGFFTLPAGVSGGGETQEEWGA